ncbi:MAG: IclR family transcriptional regulator [Acidimicrobiales bacterium]
MSDGVLSRALLVVEALVEAGEPVGPRALARTTGIDRSAVGRLLQQLESLEILTSSDGQYEPGPRLFMIGRTLSSLDTLPTAAGAVLSSLVGEYDETSYVCVLHGHSAVFTFEFQSSKPLRYVVDLGRPIPLHAGAAGRAILLGLPEAEARSLLTSTQLTPLTEHTLTTADELLDRRSADLDHGYAVSRGERVEGGVAVAAPFYDNTNRCQGSIVLTCPLSRFEGYDENAIGEAVRESAAVLSARLGAHVSVG